MPLSLVDKIRVSVERTRCFFGGNPIYLDATMRPSLLTKFLVMDIDLIFSVAPDHESYSYTKLDISKEEDVS